MSLAKCILERQWVCDPVTGTWRKRPMCKGEEIAMGLHRESIERKLLDAAKPTP